MVSLTWFLFNVGLLGLLEFITRERDDLGESVGGGETSQLKETVEVSIGSGVVDLLTGIHLVVH